jgi:hypothetical protein
MSGFAATSGKFEIFAPGDDTHVMFNDNNDINAISTLAFTKGTGTLSATILATATLSHDSGDLTIKTDGGSAGGIIIDSEDDTVEIKLSGALSATFGTGGLNLASGDSYSIDGTAVVSATGAALIQKTALTGLSELSSADSSADFLLISDTSDSSGTLKKISPDNLGITGGGAGTDALQRALRTLGLVEVDAS